MAQQNENEVVRIDLTADQKQALKTATDKDAQAIELTVQELEQRIAPTSLYGACSTGKPVPTPILTN